MRGAYIESGLHAKNLSRTVEDSATIFEPILPWTVAGAYMAGTLGINTLVISHGRCFVRVEYFLQYYGALLVLVL